VHFVCGAFIACLELIKLREP